MGQLAISDKMLCKVTEFAKAHGVPVEQQVEELLHEAIMRRKDIFKLNQSIKKIAAMTPKGVKQTDSTLLIREDRDR
jgi:antitoxin FitA